MSVLSDQRFILIPDPSGYYKQGVTYQILAEEPNTIETWTMKKYPDPTNTLSPMKVMNLAVIDSQYVEKMISDRWDRDLRALWRRKRSTAETRIGSSMGWAIVRSQQLHVTGMS